MLRVDREARRAGVLPGALFDEPLDTDDTRDASWPRSRRRWTRSDARCLVVYCHPVPESFGAALRDAAVAALAGRGWEVRLVDLYAEGSIRCCGAENGAATMDRAPADPALAPHIENLKWAEAILFVYPTWWYGLPAMLKGWLDRVWATDVAFQLAGRRGRIVSLMTAYRRRSASSPPAARRWWWSF